MTTCLQQPIVRLSELVPGERAQVVGFEAGADDGDASRQWRDEVQRLGLVPGTEIRLVRRAPLGEPVELSLRGYSLVVRVDEASSLQLTRLPARAS